jgi:glutamate 5-kinase
MSGTTSDGLRSAVVGARRVVVKVGSSSVTTGVDGVDVAAVDRLADILCARRAGGVEVVLVSSGAIAAGLRPLGQKKRPRDLATSQAAASVGQGLLIAHYTQAFARHGVTVGQVLLTADDMIRRSHYRNAQRTLTKLLELGVLPVVNENDTVATDEIRLGDNDRLAALVAHLVRADLLLLLSDVDGLYDIPPARAGARFIPEVRRKQDLNGVDVGGVGAAGVGKGGMVTKLAAARIATTAGIPVVLAASSAATEALSGAVVGTFFHADAVSLPTRLLWLAHATDTRGRLHLDAGAVAAVVQRRASLLPAGVTAVDGDFHAGDPVDLLDESGHIVARGLVNFDVAELPELLGRSTRELARERGQAYEREVVHRDDLVIIRK